MKPFKDLDLTNAFLFSAVMSDEETCRLVLETILGFKLPKVKVSSEHTVLFSSDFRSVRFDVYARDAVEVSYNLEMQGQNTGNLAMRSRYHQAQMDVLSLEPGEDFKELKPSYVIFICTFDPFGKGLYRYDFENYCKACDLELGDGTCKIFLNTKGRNPEDMPDTLVHLLKYVEESTDDCVAGMQDEAVVEIHRRAEALKKSREMEVWYMTMEEMLQDCREEAMEEGLEAGEDRTLQLIARLSEDGRINEIGALYNDKQRLKTLFKEYHL